MSFTNQQANLYVPFIFYRQEIEYYHGNKKLPVYEHPLKGYSGEQIVHILCNPSLSDEIICCTHPVLVESNVSFVVDLSKLAHLHDVRPDDLGTWKCTGSRILTFAVKINGRRCTIASKRSNSAMMVDIRRQYYVHATDNDFHRMIAFLENTWKGNGYNLNITLFTLRILY